MKIIIDIPEETLDAIKSGRIFLTHSLHKAFENATPLPKMLKKIKKEIKDIEADAYIQQEIDRVISIIDKHTKGENE